MDRLKTIYKRGISKFLINNFNYPKVELSEYLFENREYIVQEARIPIEPDDIIYTIADSNNRDYEEFVKILQNEIRKIGNKSKVSLLYEKGIYYVEKSVFGINIDYGLGRLLDNKLCGIKDLKEGHSIYERFCALFLKNFMFTNIDITHSSNDLGIDIIAEYNIENNFNNSLFSYVLSPKIYVLAQVKFHNSLVDTSYLRKLIGDSLFIRFERDVHPNLRHNPLYLLFFSHLGYTEEAKKFAHDNKIFIIDSRLMIDLICCREDSVELESVKYLLSVSG